MERWELTDCPRWIRWFPSAPRSDLDLDGCLVIAFRSRARGCQGPDGSTINRPNYLIGRVVDRVSMKAVLAARVGVEGASVVSSCLAFAKVVALHLVIIGS